MLDDVKCIFVGDVFCYCVVTYALEQVNLLSIYLSIYLSLPVVVGTGCTGGGLSVPGGSGALTRPNPLIFRPQTFYLSSYLSLPVVVGTGCTGGGLSVPGGSGALTRSYSALRHSIYLPIYLYLWL
jgi:hypothetical protein